MDQEPQDAACEPVPAKRLARRRVLAAIGAVAASAAVPISARQAPRRPPGAPAGVRSPLLRPLAAPGAPRALTPDQLETLGALVDTMIPATDTPGARAAGVHTFLDDVASIEPPARAELQRGIAAADARAAAMHGRPYRQLATAQRDAVMDALSRGTPDERAVFASLKRRTIDAYYRSEIGQIGELRWVGHEFHSAFPGACTHADPLRHPRARWEHPVSGKAQP